MLVIQNINMFTFKHPKYYKELRARNKSDQAISSRVDVATSSAQRAPDPGLKQRDSQVVNQVKLSSQSQATSSKHQASSRKRLEAPSNKLK